MPTVVEPLSYSALDYLKSFGVVAVAISPSGRVFVSRDPKGAAAAFWCRAADADVIANAAWMNGDIPGAAHRLGLTVTAGMTSCDGAWAERTSKIDEEIAKAVDAGVLKAVQQRIQAAQAVGEERRQVVHEFIRKAQRRLRQVIADAVAKDGEDSEILHRRRVRGSAGDGCRGRPCVGWPRRRSSASPD